MLKAKCGLLASVAALAIGAAAPALAQTRVMTVALPDGGTAQIEYTGNIPPRVSFTSTPTALEPFLPVSAFFGPQSPFAMIQRISAEMDREAAAMLRYADSVGARAQGGQPIEVAFGNMPPGSRSYSFVSTVSGNGVCARSVEVTSTGNGAPKVVSHSSGNCGPAAAGQVNAATLPGIATAPAPRQPAPAARPDILWTSADGPNQLRGMVRQVASAQR